MASLSREDYEDMQAQMMQPDMGEMMATLPYNQQKRETGVENLVKWILNPKEIIETLELNLRGLIPGDKPNTFKRIGIQLLNDEGVRVMVDIVMAHVNKVVMMSEFTEKQIMDMMYYLARDVNNNLYING